MLLQGTRLIAFFLDSSKTLKYKENSIFYVKNLTQKYFSFSLMKTVILTFLEVEVLIFGSTFLITVTRLNEEFNSVLFLPFL